MKKRVLIFLFASLASLLVVPVINIVYAPSLDAIKWKEKSFLYNFDFGSRLLARALYPLGISTDPDHVIIGRDGWLYLGDKYEQTRSVDRRSPTASDLELGKQIGAATDAWEAYLSSKGVKLFRVMIGPNKDSIYPEHLPNWARSVTPNVTDALLAGTGAVHYIDMRATLLSAKGNYPEALYYKTDTHWNYLGAGVAFRHFAKQVAPVAPEIRWPSDGTYSLSKVIPHAGGDLANFLRMSSDLSDPEPLTGVHKLPVETVQYDYDTKDVIRHGENPQVYAPSKPVLITSNGALNNKRVLWLRDSFGTAMSPLMAATFSDVLQLHWEEAIKPGGRFVQLVEDWKPDYVFFTVVERSARASMFTAYPPTIITPKGSDFESLRAPAVYSVNDLKKGTSENEYQTSGIDPFIDFSISSPVSTLEARFLNIGLNCNDGALSVPLQVFWLGEGASQYDEVHSVRLAFPAGESTIDLRTVPGLTTTTITRIRLDIDSQNSCSHFKLNRLELGRRTGF